MNLNKQEPSPQTSYRTIPLTQGQFAIVDAADFEWLSQWKWYAMWNPHTKSFYAARGIYIRKGRLQNVKMHRFILGLETGDKRQGDHINHNTLDNRRENLRIATGAQNAKNATKRKDNPSGFKGVTRTTGSHTWRARIRVAKKEIHIGCYETPEEAYKAYCEAARRLHGEFCHLG